MFYCSLQDISKNTGILFDKSEECFEKEIVAIFNGDISFDETEEPILINVLGLFFKTRKNYFLAEKFFKRAIEAGNSKALNNLGYYYQHTEKNYFQAEECYRRAIEVGNTTAESNLGTLFLLEKKNLSKAAEFYSRAASKGDITGKNNLIYLRNKNLLSPDILSE